MLPKEATVWMVVRDRWEYRRLLEHVRNLFVMLIMVKVSTRCCYSGVTGIDLGCAGGLAPNDAARLGKRQGGGTSEVLAADDAAILVTQR